MSLTPQDDHQVGDWIWSKTHESHGKIVEADELWGQLRYHVWLPSLQTVTLHQSSEIDDSWESPDQESDQGQLAKLAAVNGRLIHLLNDDKLLSPLDAAVIPLPHQIRALKRIVANPTQVRYLMADEVGLGKTIEAGLALRELKLRGLAKRILIIAPKGLIPQWIVEMKDRFGEDFRFLDPGQFKAVRQMGSSENIWANHDQVICSMDGVKPLETRKGWDQERIDEFNRDRIEGLAAADWDLIIADESHRLGGSSDTVARHVMARTLANSAPYLLLLSATPHQGKSDAFHRLMSLLDPETFPNEESVTRERVAPYIIRTEKRDTVNHDGGPLFKPRLTKLVKVSWEGHEAQQELYEAVTEYVREGYNQARQDKKSHLGFLMVLMQRLVTSSTRAIVTTLERRLAVLSEPMGQLELFPDEESWHEMDGQEQLDVVLNQRVKAQDNEKDEVRLLLDAARKVDAQGPDAKAKALLDWIYRMQAEEEDPELKVLIFTEFVPTQIMLTEFLEARGMSVVGLNGSLSMEERKKVQLRFSQDVRIMISTDAGGEGLNLQFCHVIINFDLGWKPMALEQRIGRLDRIGQGHIVKALNFLLEDSVESRIQEVLETKLETILREFGVDKTNDLLDSVEGSRMFDRLFIEALLEPDKLNAQAEELAQSLQSDAASNAQSRIIQGDGSVATSELNTVSSQPLGDLLEMLIRLHLETSNGQISTTEEGQFTIQWPGDSEESPFRFPGNRNTRDYGELLTLDHPRIRAFLTEPSLYRKGQAIPALAASGIPKSVDGIWSLWILRIDSFGHEMARVFPILLRQDGKPFPQTANYLWDHLPGVSLKPGESLSTDDSESWFQRSLATASEEGREHWDQLERQHKKRWEKEQSKAGYHFEAKKRNLEQLGLREVRSYRLRRLEQEHHERLSALEKQRSLLPRLDALSIISITAS